MNTKITRSALTTLCLLLTGIVFNIEASAQEEEVKAFFPDRAGVIFVTQDFDKDGKLEGESNDTITKFEGDYTNGKATLRSGGENMPIIFRNGEVITDIVSMMSEILGVSIEQASKEATDLTEEEKRKLEALKKHTSITGEPRGIPMYPKVGEELPEYKVTIKCFFKITTECTDRKVTGREVITTPAGTFDCFIIEESVKMKTMLGSEKIRTRTWYARGIGSVKQEELDKKGRVTYTTVLKEIKNLF